jgi:hypothetical protein
LLGICLTVHNQRLNSSYGFVQNPGHKC